MNKKIKLIISVMICANLVATSAMADEIGDKKQQSNSIEEEIGSGKEKIKELEKNKEDVLQDMVDLNEEINALDNEIYKLKLDMDKATTKIGDLNEKAKKLEKDLEDNKDIMYKRMKTLYKNQGQGYIEALFESKGLSDFFNRLEMVKTILDFDKGVLSDFANSQKELQETLQVASREKEALQQNMAIKESKSKEIDSKKNEKSVMMAKIEEDIDVQEKMIAQKESEFQEIVAIINNMEEASKRPSRGASVNSQGGQVSSNGEISSITGNIAYPITSGYGWRTNPISGKEEFQAAVDIGAPQGAGVHSLMDGTVAYSGWMNGYGNVVVINHGSISSLYAHNSQLLVSAGDSVKGGQQIALVGTTGYSTGPHIHFEVTNASGEKIDPTPYYIY
ncbi:peptidoglycan DD-metalloendopeptidase family protein [uncultured Clostridium sp.]|uniref:murein hydrolase activator EnvC family protein n=1 Tax=uncultured Clostridium sp. TaxID=59620 RepID=UPI003217DACE